MPKGTLLQLIVKGDRDRILTGNPEVTFFKKTYKKYTNFAIESIRQNFKGNTSLGNRVECKLEKVGDLIHKINLNVQLPTVPGISKKKEGVLRWVDNLGFAMIEKVELIIGGNIIDFRTGEWLYLWSELSSNNYAKYIGVQNMTGNISGIAINKTIENLYDCNTKDGNCEPNLNDLKCNLFDHISLYIPLDFWFCRDFGYSLPITAIQNQDIVIAVEFKPIQELIVRVVPPKPACYDENNKTELPAIENPIELEVEEYELGVKTIEANLWVDYIFLENTERKLFSQNNHFYIMDQLQMIETTAIGSNNIIDLPFNGIVKELVFVLQKQKIFLNREYFNYTNSRLYMEYYNSKAGSRMLKSANITFNGEKRFELRDDTYFNLMQPYENHSWIPKTGIYSYSFCIEPENVSATGGANFSRLNNVELNLNIKQTKEPWEYNKDIIECRVYAKSVNFIAIQDGFLSKAFMDTIKS